MAKNKHPLQADFRLGVLGAGQLGKMLGQAASPWHLPLHFLDQAADFPAAAVGAITVGDFRQYADVLAFGRQMDVLTIEIEHVNTEALKQLVAEGITVHPAPDKLEIIKDKGLQKLFFEAHGIPTADFQLFENEEAVLAAIQTGKMQFPFVQKSRKEGYDGKGVAVIQTEADLPKLLPGACLVENMVDIALELALIVAKNASGEIQCFPLVEMAFNPLANLVEFLACPAQVSPSIEQAAIQLAERLIAAFDICGLLAVEMFLDQSGRLWINEVAPRPHNSGHHSINSCYTSQFEQHLRGILNWPLGSTQMLSPSIMVNLLGEPGYAGPAIYQGLEACLAIPGVNLHLYGKAETKPFRKMGHATILAETLEDARQKATFVKDTLKIVA
ncbi:MAG TPA: 5-(carboxyamino)imidazole ribonucleotide synthase [Saprospiraceae bacterium]|nr:5-(carboxyamino)imidazole ribonucleotide synthase [Saprospiraceae bacterium]HMQ81401.1 5-(carboxyamino)imidazole ribonucleotide synthase [Saprospiraceae bacterium]